MRWLLAEWPEGADEPVKYWPANLDQDLPLVDLDRLAKLRWRVEHDDRELKDASAWTNSRAAAFKAGTTTSPWSWSLTPS